jgi:hypothetical protein
MIDIVTYRWHKPWEYVATRKYQKPGMLYTEENVQMMHRMIRKNMSLPYQINHYSQNGADRVGKDVISCSFVDEYPGWYQFFSFMKRKRPYLFIGLDNVIVKDIAPFVEYAENKGFHTCQSYTPGSCYTGICWVENCQEYYEMFDKFFHSKEFTTDDQKWQDEKFIEQRIKNFKVFPGDWARSYKNHYKKGKDCRNAKYFHFTGFPKPYELVEKEPWIKEALYDEVKKDSRD